MLFLILTWDRSSKKKMNKIFSEVLLHNSGCQAGLHRTEMTSPLIDKDNQVLSHG